jgi:hypothetical protein
MLAEGARWIWKPAHALCPSAVESLDDSHGREPRHQVAVMRYGAHPARHQAW